MGLLWVLVSLINRSKFTVLALFYFVFEDHFPSTSPPGGGGGLYLERLIFGILRYCIPLAAFAFQNEVSLDSELIKPFMFYYEKCCTAMRLR